MQIKITITDLLPIIFVECLTLVGVQVCATHMKMNVTDCICFCIFFIFDEKSYKSIVLVLMQMYSSWDLSRFVISVHRHDLHAALMRGNITL